MTRTGTMREIARLFSVVEGERRYFQDLAANLPQAIAVFDAQQALAWSNAAFHRLHSSEKASLADVLPTTSLRVAAQKILEGGREPFLELVETPAHIQRFALQPNLTWAAEPEVLVLIEDLTAAAAAARAETEARFAPLKAITWKLDRSRMEFIEADHRAAERLGFESELWTRGRSFWSRRFSNDELARVREIYQKAALGPLTCEYTTLDQQGHERWLRDHVLVEEGILSGVTVEITSDVAQSKSLRRDARLEAQHALAASVAHENNNLLMVLRGYGEDLLHGLPEESPLRANIREILGATDRLSGQTKILAAFTAKQPPPAPQVIALDQFLAQRDLWMAGFGPGGELVWQPGSGNARVETDPDRLADCLKVLMRSLEGPVRMTSSRVNGNRVRIELVSTAGKAPPVNAFEISLKPDSPLGPELHATHAFLRATGADIVLLPGGYEILMPRRADLPAPDAVKHTVLVVDDEASIRTLLRRVLERAGYEVIEAASGETAMALAADHHGPIPLLVSDVVMPGMGGVELAENLSLRRGEIKTLLISGQTGETALASAKLPRGFDFLQKPFSLPDLLAKVKALTTQASR